MAIDWNTEIPLNQIASDCMSQGVTEFTKLILVEVAKLGLSSRLHTIESVDDHLNMEINDRVYLRNSRIGGDRCYLFVSLEYGANEALVGFGQLQHSGGEPSWGERYYDQTQDNASIIASLVKSALC